MSFVDWIKAKAKGGNNTHVYMGYKDGKPVYVGISKDVDIRAGQHGDRFDKLVRITEEPLNRGHARSIEQAIIHNNPHFENSINSISRRGSYIQMLFRGAKIGLITTELL
jgi:predicted GIY-YIG superfamily endonuclease